MKRSSFRLKGGVLAFLKEGEGPPVVLIHGAGNRAEIWKELFAALTEAYTLYVLDLPGHGCSSYMPCLRIEDYSSQILEFLEAADLEGVTLVGHSMGGAIALKAVPFSKRVATLVLVGTGPRLRVNPRLLSILREDFSRGVELMVHREKGEEVARLISSFLDTQFKGG